MRTFLLLRFLVVWATGGSSLRVGALVELGCAFSERQELLKTLSSSVSPKALVEVEVDVVCVTSLNTR